MTTRFFILCMLICPAFALAETNKALDSIEKFESTHRHLLFSDPVKLDSLSKEELSNQIFPIVLEYFGDKQFDLERSQKQYPVFTKLLWDLAIVERGTNFGRKTTYTYASWLKLLFQLLECDAISIGLVNSSICSNSNTHFRGHSFVFQKTRSLSNCVFLDDAHQTFGDGYCELLIGKGTNIFRFINPLPESYPSGISGYPRGVFSITNDKVIYSAQTKFMTAGHTNFWNKDHWIKVCQSYTVELSLDTNNALRKRVGIATNTQFQEINR